MTEESNLYPNDGQYFTLPSPVDQKKEKDQEENEVIGTIPVLKDIVKRLEERIEFYSSVKSIPDEVKVKPEEFMHTVAAYDLLVTNLTQERTYIDSLIEDYIKTLK
jgi:glycerophosphoryl diester phosphodiesterase